MDASGKNSPKPAVGSGHTSGQTRSLPLRTVQGLNHRLYCYGSMPRRLQEGKRLPEEEAAGRALMDE